MLKIIKLIIFITPLLFAYSCSKSADGVGVGKMKTTIDNKSYTLNTNAVINGTLNNTIIKGIDDSAKIYIKIEFKDIDLNEATYNLESYSENINAALSDNDTHYYANNTGSITISSVSDTNIKGSFDLECFTPDSSSSKTVKGEFNSNCIIE
jgi:hypothetical protein